LIHAVVEMKLRNPDWGCPMSAYRCTEKPSAFTLIGRYQRDTQGYEDIQLMSDLRELYLGMWNGLK